jgi:transcriptional regulator with XRE-family HTH domain
MDCSSRIKLERQKRSWTQEQLAERAKLSARTVQRIECGAEASAESLRLVAEAFGIAVESLRAAPVRIHFRAPWGRSVKAITWSLIGLTVLLVCVQLFLRVPALGVVIELVTVVLLVSLIFGVNGYSIRDGKLLVHRLGWATRFDLACLSGFESNPHALMGSIRLFGNGGAFCFLGLFRNEILGRYRAYVTDPGKCVVLEFAGRKIVISPDEPEAFVQSLQETIKGVCAPTSREA